MGTVQKFEKAMNQSLDDYIKDSGIVSSIRPKHHRKIAIDDEDELLKDEVDVFKRSPRKLPNEDEDDEDLLKMVIDDEDLVVFEREMTPTNDENDGDFGSTIDEQMPMAGPFVTVEQEKGIKCVSQQWRLEPKNRISQKPEGMPPAVPKPEDSEDIYKDVLANLYENSNIPIMDARHRINTNIKKRNNISVNYNNRSNDRSYNNCHNANGGNKRQRGNHWKDDRPYNDNNNNYNNGNRNYVSPWAKDNPIDKNRLWRQQRIGNGIFGNGSIPYGTSQSGQLLNSHNNGSSSMGGQSTAINSIKSLFQQQRINGAVPQIPQQQVNGLSRQRPEELDCLLQDILMGFSSQISPTDRVMFNSILHNIMKSRTDTSSLARQGNLTANEVMSVAADTVLSHINTIQQNFGNKYDMNLQKEIAALQGKCLLYRCNGGGNKTATVVSFDGPGIEETFKPIATDITMTQRFA